MDPIFSTCYVLGVYFSKTNHFLIFQGNYVLDCWVKVLSE